MSPGESTAAARLDLRLVPAALTCWAVTAIAIAGEAGPAATAVCVLIGAGAGAVSWRARRRGEPARTATAALAVALVGAGFGLAAAMRVDALGHSPVAALYGKTTTVTVTLDERPHPLRDGARVMFRGSLTNIGADPASGRVTVFASQRGYGRLIPGQPARFRAHIVRPTRRDLSVAVLAATGDVSAGRPSAIARAAESVRRQFADTATSLPPAQATALPALVLGDTSMMPPETVAAFRAAGLTHLTAVSGANVTIVCAAVLLSARLLGPRAAVGLAALALVGFVVVVGPSPSVLRAALMGSIALLGVLSHRRRQAMPALAATVIVLMVVAPQLSVDVGFALSVSATAALIVIAPVWSRRLVAARWPKPLADVVCVAAAAQLVTAPLIAGISGRVSVVSLVANIAVTVVIPPITVAGTAAAALAPLWPGAAGLLVRFTGPELWWLLAVARWVGGVPGATIAVPAGTPGVVVVAAATAGAVLLWGRWRRRRVGRP